MGKRIVCPHCQSIINEDVLKQKNSENICLVCGGSLDGEDEGGFVKEKTRWYYYKEGGGTLMNTLSDDFIPLYTFNAENLQDAEQQLKKIMPNNPLTNLQSIPQIRCPRCFSTEFQLMPKKFSILTGFATNKFDRVCSHCGKRW